MNRIKHVRRVWSSLSEIALTQNIQDCYQGRRRKDSVLLLKAIFYIPILVNGIQTFAGNLVFSSDNSGVKKCNLSS